jgi:NAD(P)-dependent dehydrogenase (short-subunit alcohol dehydrogenase family)
MNDTAELVLPADFRPSTDALRQRRVLVTGAGSGLGQALARVLAAAGATVVLLDRQVRALEAVYDEIQNAGHAQPAIYPMDLLGATPDDMHELAVRLRESLGGLDAIVHNAAELGKPAPLDHYDPQAWLRTLQINLNGPFLVSRYLLPLLRESDAGRMVFVSDRAGRQGQAYLGAYAVSKWGLEGLMQTLAAELADTPRLRVSSVDPGPLRTGLRRKGWPGERSEQQPHPDEIAPRIIYLLDPAERPRQGGVYRA